MIRSADFSECGQYRYCLTRIWDEKRPLAMCIGLNPSTAGIDKDDPTIRQLIDRLTWLGYGGLKMTNLYALVSSKPQRLFEVPDAIKGNNDWLLKTRVKCKDVIYCWGDFKKIELRAKFVISLIPGGKCFGRTKSGAPMHPMALMYAGVKYNETNIEPYEKRSNN